MDGGSPNPGSLPHQAPSLRHWLARAPYTLGLSSGFFSFFAHLGVLAALERERVPPAATAGSSAGALVGACWAAGCPTEELRRRLVSLRRRDFWDPGLGPGLLKGIRFRELLRDISPVQCLGDCSIPVRVSVFDVVARRTSVFRRGPFADIVYASCAVPFLFQPIRIHDRICVDGGIRDAAGLEGVPLGERVFYHHILPRRSWSRPSANPVAGRTNLAGLAIAGLPAVGPRRLERGAEAFARAYAATLDALERPPASPWLKLC